MLRNRQKVVERMRQGWSLTHNHGDRCWWLSPNSAVVADDLQVSDATADSLQHKGVIVPVVDTNMVQTTWVLAD